MNILDKRKKELNGLVFLKGNAAVSQIKLFGTGKSIGCLRDSWYYLKLT